MVNRHVADGDNPVDGGIPDVGLYIDDQRSIAAVSHPYSASPSLHIASLHNTVLYIHADGSASLGGTDDPDAAVFTDYVADEVPSGYEAGDLVAMTLRCLLAEVSQSIGADMASVAAAATFPATWTAERVSAVRMAMNRYDLAHVALVAESEALTAWAESSQSTWAGSDSGVAAARGAAAIASEYPVDAVTERIVVARTARPLWTRTPVLAAVALAGVLTLGGAVTALVLQDSSAPALPEIESAPVAASPSTTPAPRATVPFPTVVPIASDVPEIPAPSVEYIPTEPAPTSETTTPELPRTVPVAETPPPTSTEESPTEEPSNGPEPGADPGIEDPDGDEPDPGVPDAGDNADPEEDPSDAGSAPLREAPQN
ncbi:hypothetical protein CH253_29050 [Rhodococcus sp. 06-156-3C]|uniref:hypothetical protein n=1 Tax=Nocardiaceae TaxID=85025 RepID=UPI0005230467|nr:MULTISPECIES: hypothetical protein [Rhodococcus]OZD11433.1 hypothetical protein CH253_29050 [Rhodococcus sp. 06-156-3C]OZD13668.1 hypothetical protein CH248_26555 [Rhodococcus sp. 06-156-4a]OZD21991.1 hypothetical protein CH280_00050 [Rhodococcus sp. 06-156-4C]OZD30292.1 hypothetical protein CH284_25135 [Rhodococcus sp. 06-156-3]OZD37699.1 hypothetical protein CH247_01270 [Rhodococcus sp. 06-156-3b]